MELASRASERRGQIVTEKCSECGKEFIPAALHMYRKRKTIKQKVYSTWQCSYNCYRQAGGDK